MQFTELPSEGLKRSFKVVINANNIDHTVKNEISKLSHTVQLPGFRPGKVPQSLIEKKYSQSVRMDVVSNAIQDAIKSVVQEYKIEPASPPSVKDIQNKAQDDLVFVFTIEIMPTITIPNMRMINIKRPNLKLTSKEIDQEIETLAKEKTAFNPASKATKAKLGDKVVIDFVGSVDGVEFEGGKAENHEIILGSKTFIDNFEEQMVGTKAGDQITVKVTFPEAYHASNLAGKPAEFAVTVKEILKAEEAKIDDELAKQYNTENLEELKKKVSEMMTSAYDGQIYTSVKRQLFDELEELLKFEVPHTMLDREYQSLKQQADSIEDDSEDMSEEEMKSYCKRISLRRIRIGLMLSQYIKKHKLELAQEDIRSAISAEMQKFPGLETQILNYYQNNPKAIELLSGKALEDKAVKKILAEECIGEDVFYNLKDLQKLLQEESEKKDL